LRRKNSKNQLVPDIEPETHLSATALEGLLREAIAVNAESFGIKAAQEWADGFEFPPECKSDDADLFEKCGNDFGKFIASKRRKTRKNRLSVERVLAMVDKSCLTVAEDYDRLLSIARGIVIETDGEFVPRSDRRKLRNKYKNLVSHTVNKLLHKQWTEGTVVMLPTELVAMISGVHFSFQHWTLKVGKECGRILGDTANVDKGFNPLNGCGDAGKDRVRELMIQSWGKIEHPTVADLAMMVWAAVEKWGAENVELWKMDIKGAFNLLDFSAQSAKLLAFELTEGMSCQSSTSQGCSVGQAPLTASK
jgi:hypothetical protein